MALNRLEFSFDCAAPIPASVLSLLNDAADRIDEFTERHKNNPAAGFVPANYEVIYRALRSLRDGTLLPGRSFCEWGSGLGVIACLASMLGFDSVGIEIDPRLVDASRSLARDHRIAAQLIAGSYVPDGHEAEEDFDESHVMTLEHGRAAYDELGLDPDDFDCIFAYPWPGEDDVVTAVFDRYAARGAVLLTYHGQDGVMVRRKVK